MNVKTEIAVCVLAPSAFNLEELKKLLNPTQEATAVLLGLLE